MQIAYVGSTVGHSHEEITRRETIANSLVDADVTYLRPNLGPKSVESRCEAAFSARLIAQLIDENASEFDGFLVGCFGEPGLVAARELVDKPVIGSASSAFHIAAQLGDTAACITVLDSVVPLIRERVSAAGLEDVITDVRAIDVPIHDIDHESQTLVESMVTAGKKVVDECGVDVIVPGCMSLSFAQQNATIAERVGIPVVDPVVTGLETTSLAVKHGLSGSKHAYPAVPSNKPLFGPDE